MRSEQVINVSEKPDGQQRTQQQPAASCKLPPKELNHLALNIILDRLVFIYTVNVCTDPT